MSVKVHSYQSMRDMEHGLPLPTDDVAFPKSMGYGARLNALWVRLIPNRQVPSSVYNKSAQAPRQSSGSIYENVLEVGHEWSRHDFSGGEGLDWSPRRLPGVEGAREVDEARYWDSHNLDVRRPAAGEPYSLRLSHAMEPWEMGITDPSDLATSDNYVWVVKGNKVSRYTGWKATTPVDVTTVGTSGVGDGRIISICTSPDDRAVVLTEGGEAYSIRAQVSGGAILLDYDSTGARRTVSVYGVWYANGRFLASVVAGNKVALVEMVTLDGGPYSAPIDTTDGNILSVVASGPAIVASYSDGTIRSYAPEAGSTDPSLLPFARFDLPKGEVAHVLGSNLGVLGILTLAHQEDTSKRTMRFYQAEVLSSQYDFIVGQLQLRREWLDTNESYDVRRNMIGSRDELWWSVRESDDMEHIWRMDLVTGGLSRHVDLVGAGSPVSVAVFDDRIAAIAGSNVVVESDDYVPSGFMITPNITFGMNTLINWLSTEFSTTGIVPGGKQVELWRTSEPDAILDEHDESWVLERRISNPNQIGDLEPLIGLQSKTMALMIRIYASSKQRTPAVTRFSMRGLEKHRDWIAELPVNISDVASTYGRRITRYPGQGDQVYRELLTMVGNTVKCEIFDRPTTIMGVVDAISSPVEYITDRGSQGTYCMVQVRGNLWMGEKQPTGDAGAGLGLLGVTRLGIGQTEAIG